MILRIVTNARAIIIINIMTRREFISPKFAGGLRDINTPQVFRTLLSILADHNDAVVSILPLITHSKP